MKFVFVGAVEGSKVALESLIRAGFFPSLVVTLPVEAAHRHSDFANLAPLAQTVRSTVHYTTNINAPETLEAIREANPDLCLVIGWSQICRQPFRSIPRIGNIGFHPALLPRLRGRAVIPWTILTDQTTTGSTLFWLDEGVDSGPILLQETFDVDRMETARSLYLKHLDALQGMLPEAMRLIQAGSAPRLEQDHSQATYCAKRTAEDGLIDWREPAKNVLRLIRAVGDPYPGAFTYYRGERLIIDSATLFPRSDRYIGLTGQVQCRTENGFAVRCGDGICIEVRDWRCPLDGQPAIHARFG